MQHFLLQHIPILSSENRLFPLNWKFSYFLSEINDETLSDNLGNWKESCFSELVKSWLFRDTWLSGEQQTNNKHLLEYDAHCRFNYPTVNKVVKMKEI